VTLTIGELIERARAGEDLPTMHDEQFQVFLAVWDLFEQIRLPHQDQYELLLECLKQIPLPAIRGALPKSEKDKAAAAEAQAFWRAEWKRLKGEGMHPPAACEAASRSLRRRYPEIYADKSTKTIVESMQRKPKTGAIE
jgi:hypothetical protein